MKFKRIITLPLVCGEKIIKNINLPACRNCIYYKPSTYNDFDSTLNRCEKFGTKDIITDEIHYDFADFCRKDEDKCGKDGKHFTLEENQSSKIIKHFISKNSPYGFAIFTVVLLNMYMIYAAKLIH